MAAPLAPPDQGLESYNQQIALHPLPPGTPAPQQFVTPPSGGTATDSAASFAAAAAAAPGAAMPHASSAPDAAGFVAAQMPAPMAPLAASAGADSAPAVTSMPMTPSTLSDSHGLITSSSGFESFGWFIVPSTSNQYGDGIGDGAFKIDLAGDVITDWYFV